MTGKPNLSEQMEEAREGPVSADPVEADVPTPTRRVAPMTIVRIVVTVGAFGLIARKIGFSAVFHALGAANPALLAAGYGVAVITILITVRQWHGLANANGVPCTYRRCLHLELGGDVFDAALPSSIGGDVIRAASLPDSPDQTGAGGGVGGAAPPVQLPRHDRADRGGAGWPPSTSGTPAASVRTRWRSSPGEWVWWRAP